MLFAFALARNTLTQCVIFDTLDNACHDIHHIFYPWSCLPPHSPHCIPSLLHCFLSNTTSDDAASIIIYLTLLKGVDWHKVRTQKRCSRPRHPTHVKPSCVELKNVL
jgi:hypothetical protein